MAPHGRVLLTSIKLPSVVTAPVGSEQQSDRERGVDQGLPSGIRRRIIDINRVKAPTRGALESEDWVRGLLAILLFVLLALEIFCALYVMLDNAVAKDDKAIERVKDLLTLVLSPTVALFGAATGFYYGAKSESRKTRDF
jgi:hypothetical protein